MKTAKQFYNKFFLGILFFASFFLVFSNSSAQQTILIDNFLGEWKGTGKLFGNDAQFYMKWEKTLGDKFIQLDFKNSFKLQNGKEMSMAAKAFYKPENENNFKGTWFDSRGMILPLKSNFDKNSLVTFWGTPETEEGKTIYIFLEDNTIQTEDYVLKNGEWKQFGNAEYIKMEN